MGNEDHEERLRTGTVEKFVIEFSQVLVLLHDVLKVRQTCYLNCFSKIEFT